MAIWVTACVALALLGFVIVTFNDLVTSRNRARTAWSNIDVQLQRRHDLIPQLNMIVRGYAAHEQAALDSVAALRARAQTTAAVAQRGQIESELSAQLSRVVALQERYPELKASTNFLQLQRDLVDTENQLQNVRRDYNEAVRAYNTQTETFPDVLLARPFGFRALEFFQADSAPAKS